MDDVTVLEIIKTLAIDWTCSPVKIRETLIKNGYSGISEKRIKRLKSERRSTLCTFGDLQEAAAEIKRLGIRDKLTGKALEKISPKIALSLRTGELKPALVASVLGYQLLHEDKKSGLIWNHDEFQDMILSYLTQEAFTLGAGEAVFTLGEGKVTNNRQEEKFLLSVETILKKEMVEVMKYVDPRLFGREKVQSVSSRYVQALKKSFDETCTTWEIRLDKYFKKGDGYFRKHCDLFHCSIDDFHLWIGSKFPDDHRKSFTHEDHKEVAMQEFSSFQSMAEQAATELVEGIECSQCRVRQSIFAVKRCSQCKCAKYCSATCQKDHWKTHKHQCPELTSRRIAVDAALDFSEKQVFEKGQNREVDIMVKFMIAMHNRRFIGEIERFYSLENFHLNLAKVRNKKWWIYKTSKISWKENPSKMKVEVSAVEFEQFHMFCFYISQDKECLSFEDFNHCYNNTGKPLMIPGRFLYIYRLHSLGKNWFRVKQNEFRNVAEKIYFKSNTIHDLD